MLNKIYVPTNSRGFLLDLFNYPFKDIEFSYESEKVYEQNSFIKKRMSRIVRTPIADYLGVIQRISASKSNVDMYFSYNRFLKTDRDYIIYLENPLALVHYSTKRNQTFISKKKLKEYLNDPHLKGIVCLSKACYDTLSYFYELPKSLKIYKIYPLVEDVTREEIGAKFNSMHNEYIQCLYISSDFSLKGGKDILMTFEKLKSEGINNIKLSIITKKDELSKESLSLIQKNNNIKLFDFKFSKEELKEIYIGADVLLNPTRQDSFPLVVLEAMKYGNTILTTDLYAIPEMVKNGKNGFLTEPKYRFFNYDNLPNERVWNNRNKTIYSNYTDLNVINFLYNKLILLNNNRELLTEMKYNSFEVATTGQFSEECIVDKWRSILGNG